ncbi:N,N-dimethylformamidase beta subunit family domain-containing protein [Hyphomonas sp. NPDC076900]|uniref:N,N-dimethylformamidase beta subunit family domain-containing protein n=1 Tax=unclassified Hyphomonas TaxID=2630699 RepID=UPI003D082FAC
MLACYTDRLSLHPGETFALHISVEHGPCRLEIARVGKAREIVHTQDGIAAGHHPAPADADRNGCGWPVALEVTTGADWRTGYYDIVLTDTAGEQTHHFVCIKPAKGMAGSKAVLVLATNTYHSYNWWGGANAYSNVTGLMTGTVPFDQAMDQAIGVSSTQRPFTQMIIAAPDDAPRLINMRSRGFKEKPWTADPVWMRKHRISPYDGSAGFLNKWEHAFAAWTEEEGYVFDYVTDYDLETDPDLLSAYTSAFFVGHSEYWSGNERAQVERFVDAGGFAAILSGNTCFWKVRWEDDGKTYVCHKWKGFEAEDVPAELATHLWSHRAFKAPEAEITGLSFNFGGYHRLGMCVSRGTAGFTIYNDKHWSLEGTDLFYGDILGGDVPLIGYESDGCLFEFGTDGLPKALTVGGVPENLEIIGLAPVTLGEDPTSGYAPMIPPEKLDVIAGEIYGDPSPARQQRVLRGHAMLASFKRGKGEVFNTGTTEWAHGLAAKDPFVEVITHNVMKRFGVTKA